MRRKTRTNPNNPKGSSVLQVLLDCQAQGGWPAEALKQMIDAASDEKLLKETDDLFEDHRYPEGAITFTKTRRDNELQRVLTPTQMTILAAFERYMNQSNLLKIPVSTLLPEVVGKTDKTIKTAFQGLIDNGCIVALPGTAEDRVKIYMLNPEIATVGNPTRIVTEQYFWEQTGSVYEFSKNNRMTLKTPSKAHYAWMELTGSHKFVAGTEAVGSVKDGNFQRYGIVRKKEASSSGNDEATSSDESE